MKEKEGFTPMLANLFRKKSSTAAAPVALAGNGHAPVIRMRKIIKTYHSEAGDFTVLKGIDADFYRGEFIGVIGKSGSGKSTLINMMTGIDRPTSGEVYVDQTAVHTLSEGQMSVWRGRQVGIVFQFFQLLPMLSLMENIMLPMDFCKMYTPRQRKARAMELLELVEMQDHARKLPTAISGGQQQRVAIARALANDPPILIADEPTGNLDSRTAETVFGIFENLVQQGKTVVMVTHDHTLVQRLNRTLLIADGEIVNEWVYKALPTLSHSELLQASRNLQAQRFDPGQVIIHQDELFDRFYIITEGAVEIALHRPGGAEIVVNRLTPGPYFGEIELLQGGRAVANVRAAETPVELLSMDRQTFESLMAENESTRQVVENVADERRDENTAARST
jgi:ABC-type lipoprotein export system ATPase subunit